MRVSLNNHGIEHTLVARSQLPQLTLQVIIAAEHHNIIIISTIFASRYQGISFVVLCSLFRLIAQFCWGFLVTLSSRTSVVSSFRCSYSLYFTFRLYFLPCRSSERCFSMLGAFVLRSRLVSPRFDLTEKVKNPSICVQRNKVYQASFMHWLPAGEPVIHTVCRTKGTDAVLSVKYQEDSSRIPIMPRAVVCTVCSVIRTNKHLKIETWNETVKIYLE